MLVGLNRRTGARSVGPLFARMEADDHNNPSLVFWRRRLWASPARTAVTPSPSTGTCSCITVNRAARTV